MSVHCCILTGPRARGKQGQRCGRMGLRDAFGAVEPRMGCRASTLSTCWCGCWCWDRNCRRGPMRRPLCCGDGGGEPRCMRCPGSSRCSPFPSSPKVPCVSQTLRMYTNRKTRGSDRNTELSCSAWLALLVSTALGRARRHRTGRCCGIHAPSAISPGPTSQKATAHFTRMSRGVSDNNLCLCDRSEYHALRDKEKDSRQKARATPKKKKKWVPPGIEPGSHPCVIV